MQRHFKHAAHITTVAAVMLSAFNTQAAGSLEPTGPEVVVTATRFSDTAADKPINVSVISAEDISNSTAQTVPELLSTAAGIHVRDLVGNNSSATVDLRGFGAGGGQNTLILLDGRVLTDVDLAGVQWSSIPLANIERIEILRGSGAVLYGGGTTGGVINIITRSPAPQRRCGCAFRQRRQLRRATDPNSGQQVLGQCRFQRVGQSLQVRRLPRQQP